MNGEHAPDHPARPEPTKTNAPASGHAAHDADTLSGTTDELTRKLATILAGPPRSERQGYMEISLEASRLRARRLERGVTRRDLAGTTGASEADLTLLEHGLLAWADLPPDLRARLEAWTAEAMPDAANGPTDAPAPPPRRRAQEG